MGSTGEAASGPVALQAMAAAGCLAWTLAARAGEDAGHVHARGHEAGVFLGVTDVDDRLRPTLGLDYEYRLGPRWGIGAIADWAFGGEGREFIVAAAGYLHLGQAWRVEVAPGLQRDKAQQEIEGVLRVGIGYSIAAGERWFVAPAAAVDFVAGETIGVYGVTASYQF